VKNPTAEVVVQRWQALSGRRATREGDSSSFEDLREERLGAPGEPGSAAAGGHGEKGPAETR
jgi:hypothetical protein